MFSSPLPPQLIIDSSKQTPEEEEVIDVHALLPKMPLRRA